MQAVGHNPFDNRFGRDPRKVATSRINPANMSIFVAQSLRMKAVFNKIMHTYLQGKLSKMRDAQQNPYRAQAAIFENLLRKGTSTEYGTKFNFQEIRSYKDFWKQVPIVNYEDLHSYISRMMDGEKDILWPGRIKWFAKSSGTTADRSKYIPIPDENLKGNHNKAVWECLGLLYELIPEPAIFYRKNLVMGGSLKRWEANPETLTGDVSAIMLQSMPLVGRPFFTPDFETALLDDWEEKIARMVRICSKEDLTFFGGVPTWTIVLFKHILDYTGKSNMLEVWPNARAYTHGGVGFGPYKETFREFLPDDNFIYQEVYNASEGFFAAQDRLGSGDMALLMDNGIFYEFLPMSEWGKMHPEAIPLEEVKAGEQYALVISSTAGLWRYLPGDTIMFTETQPYRLVITGRTKQFINVFGEEVMVSNTDKAIALASAEQRALVSDYTVAPVFLELENSGGHQWLIEFEKMPQDLDRFAESLDLRLQELNSDYEAKRSHDLALKRLEMQVLPKGTFKNWLASKGKLGGQHKVPRLSNDRTYIEEILAFTAKSN